MNQIGVQPTVMMKKDPTTTTKQNPKNNPTPKTNPPQTPQKFTHTKKPTTTTNKNTQANKPKTTGSNSANTTGISFISQKIFSDSLRLSEECKYQDSSRVKTERGFFSYFTKVT
jgi:hypothetical protein